MTQGCTDQELASVIRASESTGNVYLLVIANRFSARVVSAKDIATPNWTTVGSGDLGDEVAERLIIAARANRLFWVDTGSTDLQSIDPEQEAHAPVGSRHVKEWQKARDAATAPKGRHGEVSRKNQFLVASEAAWRCQFEGCAEPLQDHFVPGATGNNYSYFAHIVASSSDGPRGDSVESPLLCDEPTNIMLMCDKCHRLIDRVAPERYSVELLREMRTKHVRAVRRLLGNLRFPTAQILVIGGNIEGQSFAFDQRAAEEAMWLRGLRATAQPPLWFARNGSHLGASNEPSYWLSMFQLLKTEIPALKGQMTGMSHGGAPRPPLAIFPLHGTSVLVLSGRLVGESSTTHLFQFARDQVSGARGAQWAWPANEKPAPDKFKVQVLREPVAGDSEALLRVCLTGSPPVSELPANLAAAGAYRIPTVEVTIDQPTYRSIGHSDDHVLLGIALGKALELIQDQWRIRTVHVLPIAPTAACFRLGQKMQARHHPDFILYERRPGTVKGTAGEFAPTICISSTMATLVSTGASIDIT